MAATAAFDFLARPPRSPKPRRRGLSVVSDKARSLAEAAGIVEVAGDIIDHIENIDAEDAYIIEAMRHGLHRQADYGYFRAWKGKKLPPVGDKR